MKPIFEYLASRDRMDVLDHEAAPFDLANHALVLRRLTKDNAAYALTAAHYIRMDQPGFWPFAFALLEQHPYDEKVRNTLAGIFLDEWRWRYINDDAPPSGLQTIDRELAQLTLPAHGRIFLEHVRAELSKRFRPEDNESET